MQVDAAQHQRTQSIAASSVEDHQRSRRSGGTRNDHGDRVGAGTVVPGPTYPIPSTDAVTTGVSDLALRACFAVAIALSA